MTWTTLAAQGNGAPTGQWGGLSFLLTAYLTDEASMDQHVDKYVPADNNAGWGFATAIIVLALVCIAGATYVHKATYKHPTDLTARSHGGAAEHSP